MLSDRLLPPTRLSYLLKWGGWPGRGAAWIARCNGVAEVGGSNPLAPTNFPRKSQLFWLQAYNGASSAILQNRFKVPLNREMRLRILTLLALICAVAPLSAQIQEGDLPEYNFKSVPFNSLGITSLADFRGKPVFVEFWGTR